LTKGRIATFSRRFVAGRWRFLCDQCDHSILIGECRSGRFHTICRCVCRECQAMQVDGNEVYADAGGPVIFRSSPASGDRSIPWPQLRHCRPCAQRGCSRIPHWTRPGIAATASGAMAAACVRLALGSGIVDHAPRSAAASARPVPTTPGQRFSGKPRRSWCTRRRSSRPRPRS